MLNVVPLEGQPFLLNSDRIREIRQAPHGSALVLASRTGAPEGLVLVAQEMGEFLEHPGFRQVTDLDGPNPVSKVVNLAHASRITPAPDGGSTIHFAGGLARGPMGVSNDLDYLMGEDVPGLCLLDADVGVGRRRVAEVAFNMDHVARIETWPGGGSTIHMEGGTGPAFGVDQAPELILARVAGRGMENDPDMGPAPDQPGMH